jgi:hypothetical protein
MNAELKLKLEPITSRLWMLQAAKAASNAKRAAPRRKTTREAAVRAA